jgi:cell division inhibitor SulA/protein ImuA
VLPSGFANLDDKLGGGWPLGVLTEVLQDAHGIGELRLLMPALARLGQPEALAPELREQLGPRRQICWLMPPHIPYAPALLQQQIDLARMLVVDVQQPDDGLWAMEQVLRSKVCTAVLGWFNRIDSQALRRLQLAAEAGFCWVVVFRHSRFLNERATAPLRLQLQATATGLHIRILRNRYGPVGALTLAINRDLPSLPC